MGKEMTKSSILTVVLSAFLSPSVKREMRPSRPKSAMKERESRAVTEAGLRMFTKRWLRAAMPTPPMPRFQAVPPWCICPGPNTEYGEKPLYVPSVCARAPRQERPRNSSTAIHLLFFFNLSHIFIGQ